MFNSGGFQSPSTSSPFGAQSAFKPNTGFSNTPVFGSTTGPSLFSGSTTQQSGGLFGSTTAAPSFGQPQTTQPAFGTSGGLFGAQQNATPSTGIFGATTTSAFGQSKPFGFGGQPQTSGLFGQSSTPTQPQQSTLFGQPAAQSSSGLFSSTPGFGGAATGGTTIKFTPVTGTDTMVKNGTSTNINTRHHCITCMKEYENKSLEELRLEDYAANRKGAQQGTSGSLGLFGSTGQSTSLFGSTSTPAFGTTPGGGVFGSTGTSNSLFGKPAGTATAFGTPAATTTSTFGFNTSTASNPFGAQTPNKPFGTTTPGTGLFGQTTQASTGFGTQPTSGFGAFGTQQNTSLFGQTKPTFNLGGTNTSSAFSFNQPATTSQAGSNLFGAKPATSTFGGFGTPSATGGAPGTAGAFGTPAFGCTPTQGTSLFGNTGFGKPNTGFNFGGTATTNTLGSGGLNLGGGSLFGNTQNKPGGLFGQTNTNLFGGNTFGNTGNTFNTGSTLGGGLGGGGLFGNTTLNNPQGGLGGGQNINPINQHILAYASMPFGDSPLFKNLLPQTGKTDELLKPTSPAAQKALITGQNFKASPKNNSKIKVVPIEATAKKSLFDGLDEEDDVLGGSDSFSEPVRQSPKRLVLRTRPFNELSLNQRNLQFTSNNLTEMSPILKTSPRFSLRPQTHNPLNTDPQDTGESSGLNKLSLHIVKSLEPRPMENTMAELCPNKENDNNSLRETTGDNSSKNITTQEPSTTSSNGDSESEEAGSRGEEEHPTGIFLRRNGYYTIPKLDQLTEMLDSQGRCVVENFTVGRINYGNLFFPDTMDVAGLNLDEIVHFRHKEVIVYPDDNKKPPVGEGLNRKAQVTLDRVWPVDKTTRLPITEPTRIQAMDYEGLLRRVSAKNSTKFVEYRPQTGSWVFKVDHFSKYGLNDSDEEEAAAGHELKKQKLSDRRLEGTTVPPPLSLKQTGSLLGPPPMQLGDEDEDMDDGIRSPFDLDEKLEGGALSPTSRLGREIGASSHKIQLMKASFFDHADWNVDGEYLDYEGILEQPSYKVQGFSFDSKQLVEALSWYKSGQTEERPPRDSFVHIHEVDEMEEGEGHMTTRERAEEAFRRGEELREMDTAQPKVYVLKHSREVIPYPKTPLYELSARCLLDIGIFNGRGMPLKWGPKSLLVSQSPASVEEPADVFSGRQLDDFSPSVLQLISVTNSNLPQSSFQEMCEGHLIIALKYSSCQKSEEEAGGGGCPLFTPKPGVRGLLEHTELATELQATASSSPSSQSLLRSVSSVWGLCKALWGPLSIEDAADSHLTIQQRKWAVSEWLKSVVEEDVLEEVTAGNGATPDSKESPQSVFTYLTGHQISEACQQAQRNGDHRLSLLLSQVGSGAAVRGRAGRQLVQWRDTEADQFIDTVRLKLFMLLAGLPTHQASDRLVNVCSQLDWIRIFALHLWYMIPLTGSVTDALLQYEKGFSSPKEEERYAKPPLPRHLSGGRRSWGERAEGKEPAVFDLLYHLLKLFSVKSHPLEQLLNPFSFTSDHLDYSLSWFLMRVLSSLGYSHASEFAACLVHSSFASQLESHGLWHWAIFVLLHISDPHRRKNAVLDVINRHASVESKSEEEEFLISKLKVPSSWLYEAKARRALFAQRFDDAAKYLIKAELWNEAHSVIIEHIISRAIINEKYDYLESLLSVLSGEERRKSVNGWESGGAVVLDYVRVVRQVERLVAEEDLTIGLQLEQLAPQIIRLCHSLKLLQANKPIDRLRQDEMTKRISGLIQNLMAGRQAGRDDLEDEREMVALASLVSELPLVGDNSQWEWLRVMSSWRISATD